MKAVTLSCDDGVKEDIKFLDIISNYNLKCTFNLVATAVENETRLTKKFIRENILGKGHEISNHGFNHRVLDVIRNIEGIQDTLNSRIILEKEFGIIVRGMAFADRAINKFKKPVIFEKVRNYLEELDRSLMDYFLKWGNVYVVKVNLLLI